MENLKINKNGGIFINTIFILIILSAIVFIFIIYYDVKPTSFNNYVYNKPSYKFNDVTNVFLDKLTLNKLNYAYENSNDGKVICLYGKSTSKQSSIIINNVVDSVQKTCSKNEMFLGTLYINKNYVSNVYDINCGLTKSQIEILDINNNKITSIMCNKNWFGFYNNDSLSKSYNYQIVN